MEFGNAIFSNYTNITGTIQIGTDNFIPVMQCFLHLDILTWAWW